MSYIQRMPENNMEGFDTEAGKVIPMSREEQELENSDNVELYKTLKKAFENEVDPIAREEIRQQMEAVKESKAVQDYLAEAA